MRRLSDVDEMAEIKSRIEAQIGRPIELRKAAPCYRGESPEDRALIAELQRRSLETRLRWAREQSVVGARFASRTFASFDVTDGNHGAFDAAVDVALGKRPGLGLTGPVGVGKTHLAAAIANACIEQGRLAICVPTHQLLAKIRASYDGSEEAEAAIVRRYAGVDLLVLDDLGKEGATRWSVATLFAIVDTRYERGRPLVVTTNHTPKALRDAYRAGRDVDPFTADALVDRLLEMTAFPWIELHGASRRSGIAWGAKR